MPTIKLKSSDGQIFEVEVNVAKMSKTIRTMLEDCGFSDDESDEPVPLPNVNGATLTHVIRWAEHHVNDPQPEERRPNFDPEPQPPIIAQWDRDFLKIEQGTLFDIFMAANYLDIPGLMDLAADTVACMFKGKRAPELRQLFGIVDDFSGAERVVIRQENDGLE